VRDTDTGHCWPIKRPQGTTARSNREVGLFTPLPTPAPPTPAPPPTQKPVFFVTQYAKDSLRLRIGFDKPLDDLPGAILPNPRKNAQSIRSNSDSDVIDNGNIQAVVNNDTVVVSRKSDGQVLFSLLSTTVSSTSQPGYYAWNAELQGWKDERIWGMGEHDSPTNWANGLDYKPGDQQKGTSKISFQSEQTNRHITIQHMLSSRQYGVFFNHPGFGSLTMSTNTTAWAADMAKQMDFLVTTFPAAASTISTDKRHPTAVASTAAGATGSPYASILNNYYTAVGLPPVLPDWALGFWASKQRYASTTEVVDVVKNYTSTHDINVSVLVIDWKHYDCVGDWSFSLNTKTCWGDVPEMIAKLKAMGTNQVFVSLHPWSEHGSQSYDQLLQQELCVKGADGKVRHWAGWTLPTCTSESNEAENSNCLYDPSNPAARKFLWNSLQKGYYDQGITNFWTDGTEPAGAPNGHLPSDIFFYDNASSTASAVTWGSKAVPTLPAPSAFMMWPVWHAQTVDAGSRAAAKAAGKPEMEGATWSLARSAWAGSHRHNTIVWSGDIASTFGTLRDQVTKGLNMMLTYPYWNSDTGGFGGGDWRSMGELVVRWFQFSIFTSIVRLHGTRNPKVPHLTPLQEQCDPTKSAGGPVEPWAYGDGNHTGTAIAGIKQALGIRQTLLPYLKTQVALLASHGQPTMRPLWYDFPDDDAALGVADQFLFGPSYMVAPVLDAMPANGTLQRPVIFPGDGSVTYKDYFTQKTYKGGTQASIAVSSTAYFPFFSIERQS
jgi:alpha-D-xyloside xylohydrolase